MSNEKQSEQENSEYPGLPSGARRIDLVAERFELAWRAGQHPRIEDVLQEHDHTQRASLLVALLEVELELAREEGRSPVSSEYLARFPGYEALIEAAFQNVDSGTGAAVEELIAGRYRLVRCLGEGGMGSVYLANQLQPVRRDVALKLIKPGMDTAALLARFEHERQVLALMDHPHITRVLDAGTTEHGRPYIVMDLVKGIPLTDFCDRNRLDIPARLILFKQVCAAIQHAHQKGIIHRDLKPGNVLVEVQDGEPVPKVIDFGLAKAIDGLRLTEESLVSEAVTIVGTILYMAPEQADLDAQVLDIDTRADIYTLGVILYELLAGTTPIKREELRRVGVFERLRMVRECDPPAPSSRIAASDNLPGLAASRQIDSSRLRRLVRGELDWIVMKALSKERSHRYGSAIDLAQDIERFISHQPVSAGPPSASYRVRKFVRRHRGRVIAATLLLATLVGGIAGTTTGWLQYRVRSTQRDAANEILTSILSDIDPRGTDREKLPLNARFSRSLDRYTEKLQGQATDDPLGVARMQVTLGRAQLNLSFHEQAITLANRARETFAARLAPDDPDLLSSIWLLAAGYRAAGEHELAIPLYEQVFSMRNSKFGLDDPDTLISLNNLAEAYREADQLDRALPLYELALSQMKSRLAPDNPDLLGVMNNLATAYLQDGQTVRALPLFEEAFRLKRLRLGHTDPETLRAMNDLARGYQTAGKHESALRLYEQALSMMNETLGPDHKEFLRIKNNLATLYIEQDHRERALPLLEELLPKMTRKFGADHTETMTCMSNLASLYHQSSRFDLSLPMQQQLLSLSQSRLVPGHSDTLRNMNNLAAGYRATGQLDLALPLMEETLELLRAKHRTEHSHTLMGMYNLATIYGMKKRFDRSIPLFEEALKLRIAQSETDHPETWKIRANLGVNLRDSGRLREALPLLEAAQRECHRFPALRGITKELLEAYVLAKEVDKAIPIAQKFAAEGHADLPAGSLALADLLARAGSALLELKAWDAAEPILRECLEIREQVEPYALNTLTSRSMLAAALAGQEKYAEAALLVMPAPIPLWMANQRLSNDTATLLR